LRYTHRSAESESGFENIRGVLEAIFSFPVRPMMTKIGVVCKRQLAKFGVFCKKKLVLVRKEYPRVRRRI
jgi:hypothetical protein